MTCSDSLLHSLSQREAAHSPIFSSVGLALLPCTARLSALQAPFSSGTLPGKGTHHKLGNFVFRSLGLGTLKVSCVLSNYFCSMYFYMCMALARALLQGCKSIRFCGNPLTRREFMAV